MQFTLKQGETFRVEMDLQDGAGDPLVLTDYVLISELRQEEVDVDRTYKIVQELSVTILDAAGGLIQIEATPGDTAKWPKGPLVFDIEMTTGAGDVVYTPTGTITVSSRVTRHAR